MAIKRPAAAAVTEFFQAWVTDGTAKPIDGYQFLLAGRATPGARNRVKVSPHGAPAEAFSFDQLAGTSAYLLTRAVPDAQSADKNRIGQEEVIGACATHVFVDKASFRRLENTAVIASRPCGNMDAWENMPGNVSSFANQQRLHSPARSCRGWKKTGDQMRLP